MTDIYEYNSDIHITAAALRGMGFKVPDTIPDCAFVPRYAIQFHSSRPVIDGERCSVSFKIHVDQPFLWLEAQTELENQGPTKPCIICGKPVSTKAGEYHLRREAPHPHDQSSREARSCTPAARES
jgi:hypothetical protein